MSNIIDWAARKLSFAAKLREKAAKLREKAEELNKLVRDALHESWLDFKAAQNAADATFKAERKAAEDLENETKAIIDKVTPADVADVSFGSLLRILRLTKTWEKAKKESTSIPAMVNEAAAWRNLRTEILRSGLDMAVRDISSSHRPGMTARCWAVWLGHGWQPSWGEPETGWDYDGCQYVYGVNYPVPVGRNGLRSVTAAALFGRGPDNVTKVTREPAYGFARLLMRAAIVSPYHDVKGRFERRDAAIVAAQKKRETVFDRCKPIEHEVRVLENDAERLERIARMAEDSARKSKVEREGDPMTHQQRSTILAIARERGIGTVPMGNGQYLFTPSHGEYDGEYFFPTDSSDWEYRSGTGATIVRIHADGTWFGTWCDDCGESRCVYTGESGKWVDPHCGEWKSDPVWDHYDELAESLA